MEQEKLYTVAEFADLVSMSEGWIYELVKQDKIPHVKIGERTVRIPASAIEKLTHGGGTNEQLVQAD